MTDWVVNASLAKIGRLDLLFSPSRKTWIPAAVVEEIRQGAMDDPARQALASSPEVHIVDVRHDEDVLAWSPGAGETAVLSLARKKKAIAVLDDFEARSAASVFGVPCTGTLGIVIAAAQAKRLPTASPWIRALRAVGLRLSDQVIAKALQSALGETWETE